MEKKRQSNIELLRIVSMLLIISFHYVFKSGYTFEALNFNSFIIKTFYFFGEIGVNLFILITGYFLVNSKFSMKKLIKLILEVNFYFLLFFFLARKLGYDNTQLATFGDYFKLFFSIIFDRYWFATVYVLIYILSPYLNILIHNLNKKTYQKLLLTLIFLWAVIPTFFGIFENDTETLLYYNRLIWLIIIYLIGAYIRLHSIKLFEKQSHTIITALISFATLLLSIVVIYKLKDNFGLFNKMDVAYLWRPNTIPILVLSVCIFEIFINLKIGYSKIINLLASTTLGTYMLHDGPLYLFVWNIFKTKQHLNSAYPVIYILSTTLIIFIVGALIDVIRQFIEKHTVSKLLDSKLYDSLKNKSNKFIETISKFL